MKKIAFGNSLMLLGIAFMILCVPANMFNPFFFVTAIILIVAGFFLSAVGFIRGKE